MAGNINDPSNPHPGGPATPPPPLAANRAPTHQPTVNGPTGFERIEQVTDAASKAFRWVHVFCVVVTGILLLIPNEAVGSGSIIGGLAMLAYAGWIAWGRFYIWTVWFYLAPVAAALLVFS